MGHVSVYYIITDLHVDLKVKGLIRHPWLWHLYKLQVNFLFS